MTTESINLENEIKKIQGDDSKISCKEALTLAAELNLAPALIGKEINRLKIKIRSCQLGCFK